MKVLVCYDVSTVEPAGQTRLRQVARCCLDYGQRVQKSVFECTLGATDWVALRRRLASLIEPEVNSLRFYMLPADTAIEHLGTGPPADLDGPLIV